MAKRPKRPRDPNELAKMIVELATGEATEPVISPPTPATEARRKGGLHYNFARVHKTFRVTPAMEAGMPDHVWSLEEVAALAEASRN